MLPTEVRREYVRGKRACVVLTASLGSSGGNGNGERAWDDASKRSGFGVSSTFVQAWPNKSLAPRTRIYEEQVRTAEGLMYQNFG